MVQVATDSLSSWKLAACGVDPWQDGWLRLGESSNGRIYAPLGMAYPGAICMYAWESQFDGAGRTICKCPPLASMVGIRGAVPRQATRI